MAATCLRQGGGLSMSLLALAAIVAGAVAGTAFFVWLCERPPAYAVHDPWVRVRLVLRGVREFQQALAQIHVAFARLARVIALAESVREQ